MTDAYGLAIEAANLFTETSGVKEHDVAVVLGSGWSPVADQLGEVAAEVATTELPGFDPAGVTGHAGVVRSIRTESGARVLGFVGRIHGYEGHSAAAVVHGVRTAWASGCQAVILTNAAGGLREDMRVGEPVVISDHLNLTGQSPLAGPEPPADTPSRFVDMSATYSPRLRSIVASVDGSLRSGVYAALPGPQYETPAEVRMLRVLGADLAGMSTVWEAIAAHHLGLEVLGLSLVTNLATGLADSPLSHTEVVDAGRAASDRLGGLVAAIVDRL